MIRENGYIIVDVRASDDEIEQVVAYNFTRGKLGFRGDQWEWNDSGDMWGYIKETKYIDPGKYSLWIREDPFTEKDLEEIEGGKMGSEEIEKLHEESIKMLIDDAMECEHIFKQIKDLMKITTSRIEDLDSYLGRVEAYVYQMGQRQYGDKNHIAQNQSGGVNE